MPVSPQVLAVLRCPECGSKLEAGPDRKQLRDINSGVHSFSVKEGFLTFAEPDAGKYDPEYSDRYAALWAYGFETRHCGFNESLYRSVHSLAAESLSTSPPSPIIVDAGCGVGRVATDCARLAPKGEVIALDASLAMLENAQRIAHGEDTVTIDLSTYGFTHAMQIRPRNVSNLSLLRGDAESLPLADNSTDLALSINIVDRLPRGPEHTLAECYRILRPGGRLIFTDPLNFADPDPTRKGVKNRLRKLWSQFGTAEQVLAYLKHIGFSIHTWFDDLTYRDVLDGRESFQEFRTLMVMAEKPKIGEAAS